MGSNQVHPYPTYSVESLFFLHLKILGIQDFFLLQAFTKCEDKQVLLY